MTGKLIIYQIISKFENMVKLTLFFVTGGGSRPNHFKFYFLYWGGDIFSWSDFSSEGGGTQEKLHSKR